MHTLARWCLRHRLLVVTSWLLLVAALVAGSQFAGTAYDDAYELPGTDSARALALLQANAPAAAGDSEQIVVAARGGATLQDPAVRARAVALFAKLATLPDVSGVLSPFSAQGTAQINADQSVAFATLTYQKPLELISTTAGSGLVEAAHAFRSDQLDVAVEGPVAVRAAEEDLGGVGIGMLAAIVVLLLIFGSLLAASLPLLSTLLALPAAAGAIGLLSHLIAIPSSSEQVMVLISLGVGVDYALFIVTRTRQGLQAGDDVETAIATAVTTSGRAVLFAGIVVCIAMLGLSTIGISLLTGFGVAAGVGVLFTMATSLTLLPALLGLFGTRVLSRRQRRRLSHGAGMRVVAETGGWWRWSAFVARRPAVPGLIAVAVIAALTFPILSLRFGSADAGSDSPHSSARQAYDLLARGFGPGFNSPLQIVTQQPGNAGDAALTRLAAAVAADPGVAGVSPVHLLGSDGDTGVLVFAVYPTGAPQDAATTTLVERLRAHVIPTALAGTTARAFVGGVTAVNVDSARVLRSKLPLFAGLVMLLSFLLLTALLRSILVPLTAALLNVLSTGAAVGTMSAVYVWGWGGDLLGAGRGGPIEAAMVVMIFAIMFGLSMDYHVFLAARIQEEWRRTGDNTAAVTRGLAITGRTITAAAVIMIAVFGSFVFGGERLIKMFGLGLAVAVFVDAFLVRVALAPAVMLALGRANWWLPARFAQLARVSPNVEIDTADDDPAALAPHERVAAPH